MSDFKIQLKKGATSNIFQVFIRDSSVTTGVGLTGLAFNTASLVAYYHRDNDTTATAIALVTMTVGTFTAGGFKEIDATNMPGYYQFCPPDAAVAAGLLGSVILLKGAANMSPYAMEVMYVGVDLTASAIPANLTQIDGVANVSATLNLKKLNVVNNAGDAAVFSSTGSNGAGINASGNGTGPGILSTGGATGHGAYFLGGATSGHGALVAAQTLGIGLATVGVGALQAGLQAQGGTNGTGIAGFGQGSGSGITAGAGITGHGMFCYGGATSGVGFLAAAVGSGNGFQCSGAAGGAGLYGIGNGAGAGITANAGATGNGLHCIGGATSGSGLVAAAVTSGTGITAFGVGAKSLLATQGISGPLDATERDAFATAAYKLDWLTITGEAHFSMLNALRYNMNWSISGTTLTVWADAAHTIAAWTATLTTDAAGVPVVGFAS